MWPVRGEVRDQRAGTRTCAPPPRGTAEDRQAAGERLDARQAGLRCDPRGHPRYRRGHRRAQARRQLRHRHPRGRVDDPREHPDELGRARCGPEARGRVHGAPGEPDHPEAAEAGAGQGHGCRQDLRRDGQDHVRRPHLRARRDEGAADRRLVHQSGQDRLLGPEPVPPRHDRGHLRPAVRRPHRHRSGRPGLHLRHRERAQGREVPHRCARHGAHLRPEQQRRPVLHHLQGNPVAHRRRWLHDLREGDQGPRHRRQDRREQGPAPQPDGRNPRLPDQHPQRQRDGEEGMTDIKQPEPDDTTATVTEEQPSEAAVEPAAENADTADTVDTVEAVDDTKPADTADTVETVDDTAPVDTADASIPSEPAATTETAEAVASVEATESGDTTESVEADAEAAPVVAPVAAPEASEPAVAEPVSVTADEPAAAAVETAEAVASVSSTESGDAGESAAPSDTAAPAETAAPTEGPEGEEVAAPAAPSPGSIPKPSSIPTPAALAKAVPHPTVTPAAPAPITTDHSASAAFGRVDENGTVYVRTRDGEEQEVGSYP